MSGCPTCGRPLALARATCLYCGARLPEASVAAAEQARQATLGEPAAAEGPPERLLVGLRLEGSESRTLASALGLSAYDAQRLCARAGDRLWRTLPVAEAEAEARRLTQAGLRPWTLPEGQVRAVVPRRATGGRREAGSLRLRADGDWRIAPGDLLLVVQGPIARAANDPLVRRLVGMASPQPGYRFHLHLRGEVRPLELDPDDFELESGGDAATLLVLREWLRALSGERPPDDEFRHLAPALAPAGREPGPATLWADSLALPSRPAGQGQEERVLLDNLAQFRFYSVWKGLLARSQA